MPLQKQFNTVTLVTLLCLVNNH